MKQHKRSVKDTLALHSFLYNGRRVYISCEEKTRIDQCLTIGRWYEHKMLGHITRTSRAGAFIDIGSNIGHHAIYFALFCPSTIVYALEPLPQHLALVLENVAANQLHDKIQVLPFGAADKMSTFVMDTNASLFPKRHNGLCWAVDSLVTQAVSVVKIDVERMELLVLEGMAATIARYMPDIYIECLDGNSLEKAKRFLAARHYMLDAADMALPNTFRFHVRQGAL
jgi:protein O-GlcNAc transferase